MHSLPRSRRFCPCVSSLALAPLLLAGRGASGQAPFPPDHAGPWDHDIILFESEDGIRFIKKGTLVEGGGVASLILDGKGRHIAAFQWFPADRPESFDRVAVSMSADDGRTWSAPGPIAVEGFPADLERPFDPTLVEIPEGYRLYFTSHAGKDGARPERAPRQLPGIYSATSTDAVHYRFEPGVRFQVEGETVIDCAVARLGGEWHLFSPVQGREGKAYHAVSRDGLAFERLPDLEIDVRGSWLGCALPVEEGLRFFGTGAGGWSATSSDGRTWRLDPDGETAPGAEKVREGGSKGSRRHAGADPGVARTRAGRYLMAATGMGRQARPAAGADAVPPGVRRPAPPAAVAANEHSVYVLREGMLHRFDARSLKLEASVRVPGEGPGPQEGEGGRRPRPVPPEGRPGQD